MRRKARESHGSVTTESPSVRPMACRRAGLGVRRQTVCTEVWLGLSFDQIVEATLSTDRRLRARGRCRQAAPPGPSQSDGKSKPTLTWPKKIDCPATGWCVRVTANR